MAATISSDIRALVDSFVDDLSALIRTEAFGSIQQLLGGEIPVPFAPARRGRPAKAGKKRGRPDGSGKRAKSGKRVRRSPEDLDAMAASVHDFVRANPGSSSEAISKGVGIPSKELKRPMQMLLANGKIRMEGQKRGATYHAGAGRATKKKRAGKKTGRRRGAKKRGAKRAAKKATRRTGGKKRARKAGKKTGGKTTTRKAA